jgi:hypothetical protein
MDAALKRRSSTNLVLIAALKRCATQHLILRRG